MAGAITSWAHAWLVFLKHNPEHHLPVAGLDDELAQSVLFALEQSVSHSKEDADVPVAWTQALMLVQALQDRLLRDLDEVERDLAFWTHQLRGGSHGLFMLLGRGPAAFLRDATSLLGALLLATSGERPDAGGRGSESEGAGGAEGGGRRGRGGRMSATNKMQQRVLMLQAVRSVLADAVSQVHASACALRLQARATVGFSFASAALVGLPGSSAGGGGRGGTLGAGAVKDAGGLGEWSAQGLLKIARTAAVQVIQDVVAIAQDVEAKMQQLMQDQKQEPSRRSILSQAMVARTLTGSPSLQHRTSAVGRTLSLFHHLGGHTSAAAARQALASTPTRPSSTTTPRPAATLPPTLEELEGSPAAAAAAAAASEIQGGRKSDQTPGESESGHSQVPHLHRVPSPFASRATLLATTPSQRWSFRAGEAAGVSGDGTLSGLAADLDLAQRLVGVSVGGAAGTAQQLPLPPLAPGLSMTQPGAAPKQATDSKAALAAASEQDSTKVVQWSTTPSLPLAASALSAVREGVVTRARAASLVLSRVLYRLRYDSSPQWSAKRALDQSKLQAALAGPLVQVPGWARRPSRLQRHWLRFSLGGVAVILAARWTWAHRCDLPVWGRMAVQAAQESWQVHVVDPLLAVKDELTRTFHDRPAIVSQEEFQADKESLLRMLEDFQKDLGLPPLPPPSSVLPDGSSPPAAANPAKPARTSAATTALSAQQASTPAAGGNTSGGGATATTTSKPSSSASSGNSSTSGTGHTGSTSPGGTSGSSTSGTTGGSVIPGVIPEDVLVTAADAVASATEAITNAAGQLAETLDSLAGSAQSQPSSSSTSSSGVSSGSGQVPAADPSAVGAGKAVTSPAAAAAPASGGTAKGSASHSTSNTSGSNNSGSSGSGASGGSAAGSIGTSAAEQDALIAGMRMVMDSYEREMRHPLRNLVLGQLVRAFLIQVQRLKLDTEAAMLEMDQILRANELSISLVAAVPALAIAWAILAALYRWLTPQVPDVRTAAVPCRLAFVELEQALSDALERQAELASDHHHQLQSQPAGNVPGQTHAQTAAEQAAPQQQRGHGAQEAATGGAGAGREPSAGDALVTLPQAGSADAVLVGTEADGRCIHAIHKVYREAATLYARYDRSSRWSEWPSLRADLAKLAAASTPQARLRVHERMNRNFKIFQR